jgi:hypothetical protein
LVTSQDIGGLDTSFQLDRRVSELFFTMWAQKMGVNVYHGVGTDFKVEENAEGENYPRSCSLVHISGDSSVQPTFAAPQVMLKDTTGMAGSNVDAKLVCDATGFSRRSSSKFGAKEMFEGWNCDAYWTYFKERDGSKVDGRLENWDYPATKHICFPEG